MSLKSALVALLALTSFALSAHAAQTEELDPFDPNVEATLKKFDKIYEQETGLSAHPDQGAFDLPGVFAESCYRQTCRVWVVVDKSSQSLELYLDGNASGSWAVSTGIAGRDTPNFDKHPDGRIYTKYTSTKYPEGDYNGLGNMPYAIFIQGGFALHGTPQGNWRKLGRKASHGCIRQHPDNAKYLNDLVRQVGVRNVWVTVQ